MTARTLTPLVEDTRDDPPFYSYGKTDNTVPPPSHQGSLVSDKHVRAAILMSRSDAGIKIYTEKMVA